MIDLTQQLTQAQIAFALTVIAVSVAWFVFFRNSDIIKKGKTK